MQGMMLAALCAVSRRDVREQPKRGLHLFGLVAAVVVMALTALQHNAAMYYGERVFKGSRYLTVDKYPLNWMLTDIYRGGDRLRVSAMGFALSLDKENGDIEERQRAWYALFMKAGHEMMVSPMIGPRGHYLELWLQYKLLLNLGYPIFADLGHEASENLRETVVTMAKVAPLRDDIASFYFLNFDDVTHSDKALQEDILREILAAAPNHRSAMWMLGNLLIRKPEGKAEGEALIRKAVAAHVEDVYAVTNEELAKWK